MPKRAKTPNTAKFFLWPLTHPQSEEADRIPIKGSQRPQYINSVHSQYSFFVFVKWIVNIDLVIFQASIRFVQHLAKIKSALSQGIALLVSTEISEGSPRRLLARLVATGSPQQGLPIASPLQALGALRQAEALLPSGSFRCVYQYITVVYQY